CLPNLLPGGRPVADAAARVDTQSTWGVGSLPALEGRDADEMLISAADDELAALVVAGVDPSDFTDPQAALEGLERVGFVVSLETRASLVTERADVVLPVSAIQERSGTFVNWEGRERTFPTVLTVPNQMSDLRVLAALADGLGHDLGFRSVTQARAELAELGPWDGARAEAPTFSAGQPSRPEDNSVVLATWRLALDESRALDGEPNLAATIRPAVARLHPRTADAAGVGGRVTVANDRGRLTLPVVLDPSMALGVVWVPAKAPGLSVAAHLATGAGELVTIAPAATDLDAARVASDPAAEYSAPEDGVLDPSEEAH
ncbi:MAG: nuoG, partial [Friedmanniella sp.]|nr:nuoG [Friedmanniella sp.]